MLSDSMLVKFIILWEYRLSCLLFLLLSLHQLYSKCVQLFFSHRGDLSSVTLSLMVMTACIETIYLISGIMISSHSIASVSLLKPFPGNLMHDVILSRCLRCLSCLQHLLLKKTIQLLILRENKGSSLGGDMSLEPVVRIQY